MARSPRSKKKKSNTGNDGNTSDSGEVGFRKPPKQHRFQPGVSGNAKGRPKGSRNLSTHVKRVLDKKIPVVDRGERKVMSAVEAILHRYLERAINGDVKAGSFLFTLFERFQPSEVETAAPDESLSEEDQAIIAALLKRQNNS